MFLGQFDHTLDEKGRLTIPVRYRNALVEGAYITVGFDQNLMVWTADAFQNVYNQINDHSITDPESRLLKRLLFSNAAPVELDRIGRVLIPKQLRELAELDINVAVVGNGDYFEIWSDENWQKQKQKFTDGDTTGSRFANLPLRGK